MKLIHIVAGLLALLSGAIALFAAKGSPLHRKSGLIFVGAMLTMSSSAVVIAQFFRPNRVNVVAGLLTLYLVSTALITVRRTVEQSRRMLAGFLLMALTVGSYAIALGVEAVGSTGGNVDGIPSQPLFLFGIVGLLGALLDARLLRAGAIQSAHRIARHLWRMTFAMWIATASFFLGQAKFFPAPLRKTGLLAIPVLLVLGMLIYSLVRVLVLQRRGARTAATGSNATE